MRYDYECEKCSHMFEIQQRVTEDPLSVCPECEGKINRVILEVPYFSVENDPVTLGQLAERNTKKMGRYQLEERRLKDGVPETERKREKIAETNRLNKMTGKQKEKYIREGK